MPKISSNMNLAVKWVNEEKGERKEKKEENFLYFYVDFTKFFAIANASLKTTEFVKKSSFSM